MTVQERIKQFGERNAPFYICDHENGEYSLCLPLDFLSGDYEDFGQEAFNRYAVEIGEPAVKNNRYTHGDGHEWGIVFTKAFENDSHTETVIDMSIADVQPEDNGIQDDKPVIEAEKGIPGSETKQELQKKPEKTEKEKPQEPPAEIEDTDTADLEQSAGAGNQYAQYLLGKLYLLGRDIPQDKEKAYGYLVQSAEQGNIYAAYFLEHFNDTTHPDLLLMATRLMHHLSHIVRDDVTGGRKSANSGIDRKLARKIKQKKIGQGHAVGDYEMHGQLL